MESIVAAGSVRTPGRRGRPPIKGARITSVELRPSERALLEELALVTDASYAAIFRRGLRLAALEAGLVDRGYKARYLAWEARQRTARRVLEQRGYDPATVAMWSADGMTDRARRFMAELEHGRWALPGRLGHGESE